MSEPKPLRRGDKAITDVAELHRILDEASVLRLKLKCLRRDSGVCVEVDHLFAIVEGSDSDPCSGWTTRFESVIGFGTAEIVGDEQDRIRGLLTIMRKFSGRGEWAFSEEMLGKTAVLRVRLQSLTGKRSPV